MITSTSAKSAPTLILLMYLSFIWLLRACTPGILHIPPRQPKARSDRKAGTRPVLGFCKSLCRFLV
jgi:hypothetical protein